MVTLILLVFAFVLFAIAAFVYPQPNPWGWGRFIAAGLAFWVLSILLGGAGGHLGWR